ncbi:D-amino-acid oxidase isoform X2 [Harmonia axyridis]|uniref:D-amino-acid oxidase isoform X2 n=1 Tax=Harmonia axyridis TaxID=115357 RepID=UPI001E27768B|nr:D-amino-acid oxidase isoform X2 [Harmonia axyridis]
MSNLNIYVVGAGIVGLTTALELKKDFRNASIIVIADSFYKDTTSYVAAGIFRPTSGDFGKSEEITRKWICDSYSYWETLRRSREADLAGVKEISGYIFSRRYPHINKYIEKLVPIYRQASEDELKLCTGDWKYGSYFSTILTDPARYLKWVHQQIENMDVHIKEKKIDSFSDVSGKCDVVVNCTGLGAKILCEDSSIVALRGQVSKVTAPWIKNFFYGDYDTYIIPGFDSVTLGGCRQYESYDTRFSRYDYLSIREKCEKMIPSLKQAALIEHRVGLRPHRIPVRVEIEKKIVNGMKLNIVHNYGHGGYGVTTCPGTSLNAVQLVKQVLLEKNKL